MKVSKSHGSGSALLHIMTTMSENDPPALNEYTAVVYRQMSLVSLMMKPFCVAHGSKRLLSWNLWMFSSVW